MSDVQILMVEDNPHDAEMALRAFKRNNLANRVHWVKDGEEALDYLYAKGTYVDRDAREHPRLVLLDLKLPKVDGLTVLREIKSNAATKAIPVVVMTSSAEERDVVESYELGVNSFITKPVDFDQFVDSVVEIGFYWVLLNKPPE